MNQTYHCCRTSRRHTIVGNTAVGDSEVNTGLEDSSSTGVTINADPGRGSTVGSSGLGNDEGSGNGLESTLYVIDNINQSSKNRANNYLQQAGCPKRHQPSWSWTPRWMRWWQGYLLSLHPIGSWGWKHVLHGDAQYDPQSERVQQRQRWPGGGWRGELMQKTWCCRGWIWRTRWDLGQ